MDPRILDIAIRYQLAAATAASLLSLVFWHDGALGVLSGGALMAGNFWFLKSLMGQLLVGSTRSRAVYAVMLGLKLAVALAAMAFLVLVVRVHPLGLALGMATMFAGLGLGVAHHMLRPSQQAV